MPSSFRPPKTRKPEKPKALRPVEGTAKQSSKTKSPRFAAAKVASSKDLNFKVDPNLHAAFKSIAAWERTSMTALLEECIRFWCRHNGHARIKRLLDL
jgi:hypothetical protein